MYKLIKYILFIIFICIAIPSIYAQNDEEVDFQTWTDLTIKNYLSQKWILTGDLGIRGLVSTKDWNQFYIRPTIEYLISPSFNVRGAVGLFNTRYEALSNALEFRIHQEADLKWPDFSVITFNHRLRFEERFFFYKELENDISFRMRYLIGIETTNFRIIGKKRAFYLLAQAEWFIPLGKSSAEVLVNNTRIYTGFGHRVSNKFRYEIYYVWQKSRIGSDDGLKTTENVLRFRFYYTINPDK